MVLVDDEVLAQDRESHGIADGVDVLGTTTERRFVGQARDRARPRRVILSSDGDRIEVGSDRPCGGALCLDFRDDSGVALSTMVHDGLEEVARPTEFGDALLERVERDGSALREDLGTLPLDDVGERIRHLRVCVGGTG